MGIEAVNAIPHIDVDQTALPGLQKIKVDRRGKANAVVRRPKASVASGQVEREKKCLGSKPLLASSEKRNPVGLLGRNATGHREATYINVGFAGASKGEKPALAEKRIVALEPVTIEVA